MEDKYIKLRTIGRGAYGTVCLCERVTDKRLVIIKQIPVETMSFEERQAALNEVKVLEMLQHPHIVEYYENFLEDKALMIVMEYMEGGTLFDLLQLQNGQLLEEKDILRIFVQMLISLQHVHSKQILHRDLKTQNILLNKNKMIVKIGDFGISKVLSSKSKAYSVVGTPCYISPELCEGKPYNQKSDIWALGCVLYELATLKKAFEAGNLLQLISKIMRGNFAPISDQYSSELSELIIDMLHLDPTKRPQINEIMCNPLVINAYMNYYADLGMIHVAHRGPGRTISFSTDAGSLSGVRTSGHSTVESTAKPSLKQTKSPLSPPRGPTSGAGMLPPNIGLCPLDNMALQCGYDLTPVPSSIVYSWGGTCNFPTRLPLPNADTEVIQVSLGRAHKAALTKDGRVVLWDQPGLSGSSLLESTTSSSAGMMQLLNSTSSSLSSLSSISGLSVGGGGKNGGGGGPDSGDSGVGMAVPKFLEGQAGVTIAQVACGDLFTACLTDRGILMTYGSGANGCLGHGNNNDVPQTKAKIVEALLGCEVTLIRAGATHIMALTNDHDLFAWGRTDNGRLGLEIGGTGDHSTTPTGPSSSSSSSSSSASNGAGCVSRPALVPFPAPHVAAKVFCGADASAVVTDAGKLFCCGSNRGNKLGLDSSQGSIVEEAAFLTPAPTTSALADAVVDAVAIGTAHSAAIANGGDLYVFGSNQFGQLSSSISNLVNNATSLKSHHRKQQQRVAPTLILSRCCTHVSCGDTFTVAATCDGRVLSWGKGARGRLGREVKGDSTETKSIDFGAGEPKFSAASLVSSHGTTLLAVKPHDGSEV